jgi:hypothetical protein
VEHSSASGSNAAKPHKGDVGGKKNLPTDRNPGKSGYITRQNQRKRQLQRACDIIADASNLGSIKVHTGATIEPNVRMTTTQPAVAPVVVETPSRATDPIVVPIVVQQQPAITANKADVPKISAAAAADQNVDDTIIINHATKQIVGEPLTLPRDDSNDEANACLDRPAEVMTVPAISLTDFKTLIKVYTPSTPDVVKLPGDHDYKPVATVATKPVVEDQLRIVKKAGYINRALFNKSDAIIDLKTLSNVNMGDDFLRRKAMRATKLVVPNNLVLDELYTYLVINKFSSYKSRQECLEHLEKLGRKYWSDVVKISYDKLTVEQLNRHYITVQKAVDERTVGVLLAEEKQDVERRRNTPLGRFLFKNDKLDIPWWKKLLPGL